MRKAAGFSIQRLAGSIQPAAGCIQRLLSHCGMGFNRSALVAGLILNYLGVPGPEAVRLLRQRRPGALFNEVFANHLLGLAG